MGRIMDLVFHNRPKFWRCDIMTLVDPAMSPITSDENVLTARKSATVFRFVQSLDVDNFVFVAVLEM